MTELAILMIIYSTVIAEKIAYVDDPAKLRCCQ